MSISSSLSLSPHLIYNGRSHFCLFHLISICISHLKPIIISTLSTDEVSHPPPHPHTGDPKHHTPSGCPLASTASPSFLRRPSDLQPISHLLQTPPICILSHICKKRWWLQPFRRRPVKRGFVVVRYVVVRFAVVAIEPTRSCSGDSV
ncbi:hypothetical protein Hanom_Chr14g01312121 [Helianthus anomalus]